MIQKIKKYIKILLQLTLGEIILLFIGGIMMLVIFFAAYYVNDKISYHNCLKENGSEELCQEIQNLD